MTWALGAISFLYFDTDVASIKTRENSNVVKIDFPTSLIENSILIETDSKENFLSCVKGKVCERNLKLSFCLSQRRQAQCARDALTIYNLTSIKAKL